MEEELARAKEIAVKFFEQYRSPVTVKSVMMEDKYYVVRVNVGLVNVQTFDVAVDYSTGKILSYSAIEHV
ncbi:MAG TPA: hypothetical protein VJ792_01035 [Candidatus Nitrosotalea sp.]|nr:hypothetical protein [Candidatus Nitrosotalea sp.]